MKLLSGRCSRKNKKPRLTVFHKLLLIMVLAALLLFAKGAYMQGKAYLAQQLLTFAWARHQQDGELYKAWPWADSAPLAQLTINDQEPLIVLSGATGSNLAFAPAWMVSSAPFNQGGNTVLVGHNDTHFKQLEDLPAASYITVKSYPQLQMSYQVIAAKVVNEKDLSVLEDSGFETITLITCYPFDADIINSDLRFVVIAKRVLQKGTGV
ncbi:class GN sortase [Psychromonas aquimarina]|uniref:class GN sortase n=1 Tax=Psychromonas aquimarina TaxID=444919 RepID=UPI0003FDADB3|nr:class GN sortase [Psychromonas aquimarina]